MTPASAKLIDPRDLLEMLRRHPLPAPFYLALYAEKDGRPGLLKTIHAVCAPMDDVFPCTPECCHQWEASLAQAMMANQPAVHACPQGFIGFVIPLPEGQGLPDCLVGGGVFERNTSPYRSALHGEPLRIANDAPDESGAPMQQMVSRHEAQRMAEEIFRALPRLLDQQVHALGLSRTTQRLEAVQKLSRDLSDCEDAEQAVSIVSEALVVLFNLPKVLIVLRQTSNILSVHSTLGLSPETFQLDQKRLAGYLDNAQRLPDTLTGDVLSSLFPGLETDSACLFPLCDNSTQAGAIVLLDIDLHSRDLALIELLAGRLAARLERLKTAEAHRQERRFSARLVDMISALSLIESRDELYRQILDMSAELLSAASGSLMLLNEGTGTLGIAAARGMTPSLAKTMSVPFGEGIAGRVAKSGFPMLVNDIERDSRTATSNRPRFKTKSFVSLPLETKGRLIGVLNLADKQSGGSFTEADLNLVQTFTRHAVLMIDRAAILEKAGQFEQLSITDPLTGLYNRRFLEDRLQEEFSRSERQQQNFCVILADLDSFKIYNDICGHIAGDNALKKVAGLMRRSARDMDVVTRYGGEEFCLILPGTGKKESLFVGERIRRVIEAESFPGENHLPLGRLTISLGVASFPADGTTTNELVHAADLALYRAKELGRNRLVLFEPSLEERGRLQPRL